MRGVPATLASVLLLACGPTQPADYRRLPVLMVHGLGDHGPKTFGRLTRQLVERGWPREYLLAPNLIPADGSTIEAGEVQLVSAAESLLARAAGAGGDLAPRRMIVVGHSMGALSSRWYATRVAPELVAAWIGVAGANHGSNVFCSRTDPGSDDMCPAFAAAHADSRVQADLNGTADSPGDESPFSPAPDSPAHIHIAPENGRTIFYFTIEAGQEDWIKPAESVRVDGTGGLELQGVSVMQLKPIGNGQFLVPDTDHDHLPQQPALADLIDAIDRAVR